MTNFEKNEIGKIVEDQQRIEPISPKVYGPDIRFVLRTYRLTRAGISCISEKRLTDKEAFPLVLQQLMDRRAEENEAFLAELQRLKKMVTPQCLKKKT